MNSTDQNARDACKRLLLVADFQIENLQHALTADCTEPGVHPTAAPYGQVANMFWDRQSVVWSDEYDAALVWTRPESAVPAFQKLREQHNVSLDQLITEVDEYVDALLQIQNRGCLVFVAAWSAPAYRRGLGIVDLRPGGSAFTLDRMNQRLVERLAAAPQYYVLDARRWTAAEGEAAFNDQLWYLTKTPFHRNVFRRAVGDLKAALRAVDGNAKKLLILDLDDTLWGGIVGECGWQSLRLGGHDPIGEAFVDFQRELKALSRRGVLLALCSKNEEAVALEAIDQHPEMILRRDDFVAWRINWRDKAENIVELVEEVNLSLDSAVFIDDNPAERARVLEALPGVLVPKWPSDKTAYTKTLLGLDCFDAPAFSQEDRRRTAMYAAERARTNQRSAVSTLEEWLINLDLRVEVEPIHEGNLLRATQLLNKTNQMNLATRRLTQEEFAQWARHPRRRVWCFSVADRFGDSGLAGLASAEVEEARYQVVDFVLSCRVLGRRIEHAMLHTLVEHARRSGAKGVSAVYRPTAKNKVCGEFWRDSGFRGVTGKDATGADDTVTCYQWPAAQPYTPPSFITLVTPTDRQAA